MIAFDDSIESGLKIKTNIKVLGIGGAGTNIVSSIAKRGIENVELLVANTDARSLQSSPVKKTIQLGVKSTKGLGSGANPEIGKRAAEEDIDLIVEEVGDADVVFITAGMGGGTGSGAAAVVAKTLREKGILTIGIVTKPFAFEGKRRALIAQRAIEQLEQNIDTLLVVPNQKLLDIVPQGVSMVDAFDMINEVLEQSVKGITYIITKPGHINVDFADLRAIIKDMGLAVMGTGRASGENKILNAVKQATASPLLENMNIHGAKGVLFNITGSSTLGLHEINEAASLIQESADEHANIIFGSVIDNSLGDEVVVTVVATGFEKNKVNEVAPARLIEGAAVMHKNSMPEVKVSPAVEHDLAINADDDLDTPAFMRNQKNTHVSAS